MQSGKRLVQPFTFDNAVDWCSVRIQLVGATSSLVTTALIWIPAIGWECSLNATEADVAIESSKTLLPAKATTRFPISCHIFPVVENGRFLYRRCLFLIGRLHLLDPIHDVLTRGGENLLDYIRTFNKHDDLHAAHRPRLSRYQSQISVSSAVLRSSRHAVRQAPAHPPRLPVRLSCPACR